MRLLRFGPAGAEKLGLLDSQGRIRDLSAVIPDLGPETLGDEVIAQLRALDAEALPVVAGAPRIGPCVGKVGKIVCIGLNFADHAEEAGMAAPAEPVMFLKATTALSGPCDPVVMPRGAMKLDWEVELGVVVGKAARYVEESAALDHVAGYCVANDVSERSFQFERGGQWTKGKSADTFAPIGSWLVTRDEVADPQDLRMFLEVDGKRYQDGSTRTMIFGVRALVSYCSRFMTLLPGDVILTGTPAGVGLGQKPNPVFLRAGQRMRLGIEGLGVQEQVVLAS